MEYIQKPRSIKVRHLNHQSLMIEILNSFNISSNFCEYKGLCEHSFSYVYRIYLNKFYTIKIPFSQMEEIIYSLENIDKKYKTYISKDSFENGILKFWTKA